MHDSGCNYLHACLLLLLAERPDHGYNLLARLDAFGFASADAAGTYRALRTLERDRRVASHWTPSESGPARRVYHVTDAGLATLALCARELRREQARLGHYLTRLAAVPNLRYPNTVQRHSRSGGQR